MKRKLLLATLLTSFVALFAWTNIASAQSFRTGTTISVASNETVTSSLWISGSTITVAGTIEGDLFCAGQNVTISGEVQGDIICAAQNITVSGPVRGDLRLAAQTALVSAEIEESATVAAQSFTLESGASIGRDLSFAGQDAELFGSVARDLSFGSQEIHLANQIGRNVTGNVRSLTLTNDAAVGGRVDYTSSNEATIAAGAQIDDEVRRIEPAGTDDQRTALGFSFGFAFYMLISLLLVSLALVLLFPQVFRRAAAGATERPWLTLLIGLATSFLVPLVIIILFVTVIGIPLAMFSLIAWMLALALSGPFTAFFIGKLIMQGEQNAVLIMLVGALVLLISYLIPVLNFFIVLGTVWFGIGMLVRHVLRNTQKPTYN